MKAEAHSKAKGRAAKKPVVKDTDKTSSTACSVARKNPKARSDAPSKALLKAAGLDEGSGKAAVRAFIGRYGFKLPASTALGIEMSKFASARGGDPLLWELFHETVSQRMSTFKTAAKFLANWEKGSQCARWRKWCNSLRWRSADQIKPTSTLAIAVAEFKRRSENARGSQLEIRPKPAACGAALNPEGAADAGAIRVQTPDGDVLFMPPNIANWLYQAFGDVLVAFQAALNGNGAFDATGAYVTEEGTPACGGEIVAWWGTELGSRREQAIIAWDYDVDAAVFVSPGVDIDSLWRHIATTLKPLGLRASQHKDCKFRLSPLNPVAWHPWRELYQETREENMGLARPELMKLVGRLWRQGKRAKRPHGCSCIDIEIYTVHPEKLVKIKGATVPFSARAEDLFPTVVGALGPMRVPLPRTPCALDHEYGSQWRSNYVAKVVQAFRNSMGTAWD